jgi:hypothetical protein
MMVNLLLRRIHMRKQFLKALATFSFLVAIGIVNVGSAQGQSNSSGFRIRVPFDFIVAETRLPAGEYSFSRISQSGGDNVLLVRSLDGKKMVVRLTIAARTSDPAEHQSVVFHRYGAQYFLFQVWPAGSSTGRTLIKSRGEREAEQKAQNTFGRQGQAPVTETVSVVGGPQ